MPAKKKSHKKLSLKPVEKQLREILAELKKQLHEKGITPAEKSVIEQDIQNVQTLIADLPSSCHKNSSYTLGV
jgi:hypothetical protein